MLEQMRKSSQSLLIYVLFGIVIAVAPFIAGGSAEPKTTRCDSYPWYGLVETSGIAGASGDGGSVAGGGLGL